MKRYMKRIISIIVSVVIIFSMVSVNVSKAEEMTMNNEELMMNNESGEQDTAATENIIENTSQIMSNEETTHSQKDEETTSEETTLGDGNGEEITSGEPETVIYNENQSRIVDQIKAIPESTQKDYMDKVKAIYIDYLTLTEDEVNGLSANDKAEFEIILETAGEINHVDTDTGVSVSAEGLPWYVKVIATKTDETKFQETYESYWDALYEQWEDSNEELIINNEESEELDEDDEYDEEYEEDGEDSDEELIINNEEYDEWEDEESQNYDEYDDSEDYFDYEAYYAELPRTTLGHEVGDDRFYEMASSYKVSFYNILEEKEYTLSQDMKAKISLPYLKEYMGYGLEIVQLKDDGSYDDLDVQLFNKSLGKILTYGLYTELYGNSYYEEETEMVPNANEELKMKNEEFSEDEDSENYDDEDYENEDDYEDEELDEDEGWDEEAYRKWAEEENSKINIDDYVVEFETGSFSEFAVRLSADYGWATKDMATGALAVDESREEKISPKTGNNLDMPVVIVIGSGLLVVVSIIFYRKREEDIV